MSTRVRIWVLALLYTFSTSAFSGAGWTEKGQIQSMTATSFSRIVIQGKFSDNVSDCRDKERFYVDFGRPGTRFIYEMLLVSVVSGKNVKLRVTGSCELKGMSEISEASILAN